MRGLKRTLVVVAALLLLAVAPVLVLLARDGVADWSRFDAQQFRSAAGRGDLDELERHAHAAVDQRALEGLTRERVRRLLGTPNRVAHRSRAYVWDLGMINDFSGPGDQGALRVRFDRAWRVTAAEVGFEPAPK